MITKRGLSETQAAEYIGLSRSTLRQGRMDGDREGRCPTPPFVRLGRKIIYLREELDCWLDQHRVSPMSPGGE
jgi:predicted DNA-binding transcriptional regulator AlpA